MANKRNIQDLFNATAYDNAGEKLGAVKEIFVDDHTGQPTFVEVGHGLFGMGSSLVPLRGHSLVGDELKLAFPKDRIKDAPGFDADNALSPEDQNVIYRHYALTDVRDQQIYETAGTRGAYDQNDAKFTQDDRNVDYNNRDRVDVDRDRTDLDDNSMIRSEERLHVDKDRVETGEVRLRKYVVSDTETVEVPVTREEVRVERTPIDGATAGNHRIGDGLGEDEASVTLHEERVSVTKETVPVEEVHLEKDTYRDTETVSEEVRKERIDVDGEETLRKGTDRVGNDRLRDLDGDGDRDLDLDRDGKKW